MDLTANYHNGIPSVRPHTNPLPALSSTKTCTKNTSPGTDIQHFEERRNVCVALCRLLEATYSYLRSSWPAVCEISYRYCDKKRGVGDKTLQGSVSDLPSKQCLCVILITDTLMFESSFRHRRKWRNSGLESLLDPIQFVYRIYRLYKLF